MPWLKEGKCPFPLGIEVIDRIAHDGLPRDGRIKHRQLGMVAIESAIAIMLGKINEYAFRTIAIITCGKQRYPRDVIISFLTPMRILLCDSRILGDHRKIGERQFFEWTQANLPGFTKNRIVIFQLLARGEKIFQVGW